MTPVLVVDAYNVIYDWWSPADAVARGICRDQLLGELASYAATAGLRVIVVFDAHQVAGNRVADRISGIEVHYTAAEETADTLIERLCFELRDQGETVTVATTDRTQAMVVFGKGVYRLSSRNLKREVERSAREAKEAMAKKRREQPSVRLEHAIDETTRAKLDTWWRRK